MEEFVARSKNDNFQCETCNITFKKRASILKHARQFHYADSDVDPLNTETTGLGYYLELVKGDWVYRCKICQIEDEDDAVVLKHLREVHFSDCDFGEEDDKTEHVCPWCETVFQDRFGFANHVEEAHAQCEQKFKTIFDMRKGDEVQVRKYIGESGTYCFECKRNYKTRDIAFIHVRRSHPVMTK